MILEALTALQIGASALSARKQRKANKWDLQQRLLAARRERVSAAKEAQRAQATTAVQAESMGATGSSSAMGSFASTASQFGSNMAFSLTMDAFGQKKAKYMQQAEDIGVVAGAFGALANLSANKMWDNRLKEALTPRPAGASVPTPAGVTVGLDQATIDAFSNRFSGKPFAVPMGAPTVTYSRG